MAAPPAPMAGSETVIAVVELREDCQSCSQRVT
jgi:hypothetical protein